eukprot:TRINITY_DN20102_c0_g1_i1.p1 TRINITY_DN20102_c0_g1~~TRINITY_DN20102_c0_g1_i1.p1  ORF type:complete len:324 (+),score=17.03 TRINITY_DN20102_c0_g1_i1:183-1154(+)
MTGNMYRSSARCGALQRAWIRCPHETPKGERVRVMHFNVLADCLARSATVLESKRGFRCEPNVLHWDHRGPRLQNELLRYESDIIGLNEVDRYEDLRVPLDSSGYDGTFKLKRSPAKDGVAVFWRTPRIEGALRRVVFLEQGIRRSKGAQVALLQRLRIYPSGVSVVICATHLKSSADESFRVQQAAEVVSALADFSRGEEQIILADVNSAAPSGEVRGSTSSVFEYFSACGYRCAYRSVADTLHESASLGSSFPSYTTYAGWASGDFLSVCDHIFVSRGIHVDGVLDVPLVDKLKEAFPERLPNDEFPSDHMSLIADVVIPH